MSNPSKSKGDRAELEVQAILQDELGLPARRALGAGRKDDIGDITGIVDYDGRPVVISVKNYKDFTRSVTEGLAELPRLMENAGARYGSVWARRRGGLYVVCNGHVEYCELLREAVL